MSQPPQNPENDGQDPAQQQPQFSPPQPPPAPSQPQQYAPPQPQVAQPQQQYAQQQYAQAQYAQNQYVPQQPLQPQAPMNALAIVAFVSSFFVGLVGIICGHIALSQIKRTGERGHGFALAGTIIGYVTTGFAVLGFIVMIMFWGIFGTMMAASTSNTYTDDYWDDDSYSSSESAFGPEGMETGAATFDDWLEPIWTPGLEDGQSRVDPPASDSQIEVTVYVDYMCPACGNFEEANGDALEDLLEDRSITLSIYPVTFLDRLSNGTNYSTRAANLFGCVVEQQPWTAWEVHRTLLDGGTQPAENTDGLSDSELLGVAEDAGAMADSELESCVQDQRFAAFFAENTDVASYESLIGLSPDAEPRTLQATPTVIIDGEHWDQAEHPDLEKFLKDRVTQQNS